MNIIGVTGFARAGKDTIGKFFIQYKGFQRKSFADALKGACKSAFGLTDEQVYGEEKDFVDSYWKISPRKILQIFGTEIFRDNAEKFYPELKGIGSDFWVKSLEKSMMESDNKNVVICDVRFLNEMSLIKKHNGTLIKVVRDSVKISESAHASEKGIEDKYCDKIFTNNGTIEELYGKLEKEYGGIF